MATKSKAEKKICGAKTRSGGTCKNRPMKNGRCRLHGGKSLSGWAHPNAKTGKYFKYMPIRLRERYQESLKDPELLALNEEVALLDARASEVLSKVDSGESGRLLKELKETYKLMMVAKNAGNAVEFGIQLNRTGKLIEAGLADWYAWNELMNLFERRRRLVESERRRRVEMQMMITAEDSYLLIGRIEMIIKEHVTDRKVLSAIANDLRGLVNRQELPEDE